MDIQLGDHYCSTRSEYCIEYMLHKLEQEYTRWTENINLKENICVYKEQLRAITEADMLKMCNSFKQLG